MSVESTIYTALSSASSMAGVTIRHLVTDDTDSAPYVVYQKIHGERISDLAGDAGLANPRFQFDVYATTSAQATALRDAVRAVILGTPALNAVHVGEGDMYDMSTRLYREMQDFSMWFYD